MKQLNIDNEPFFLLSFPLLISSFSPFYTLVSCFVLFKEREEESEGEAYVWAYPSSRPANNNEPECLEFICVTQQWVDKVPFLWLFMCPGLQWRTQPPHPPLGYHWGTTGVPLGLPIVIDTQRAILWFHLGRFL